MASSPLFSSRLLSSPTTNGVNGWLPGVAIANRSADSGFSPVTMAHRSSPTAMFHFLRLSQAAPARRNRADLFLGLVTAVLAIASAASANAQFGAPSPGTQVHDTSALHPPAGARVAIVEFADMECPACAAANPIVKSAVAQYKIPWIRHDFLIPNHIWSPTDCRQCPLVRLKEQGSR